MVEWAICEKVVKKFAGFKKGRTFAPVKQEQQWPRGATE